MLWLGATTRLDALVYPPHRNIRKAPLVNPVFIAIGIVVLLGLVSMVVIGFIAWGFERDLTSGAPRTTSGPSAGMFGGLAEIFDPAAHRSQLEREQQRHATTIAPTPDEYDPGRSRMTTNKAGDPMTFIPSARAGSPNPQARLDDDDDDDDDDD